MDFKQLMENKPLFYGIIAGVVIFLALVIALAAAGSKKNSKPGDIAAEPLKEFRQSN